MRASQNAECMLPTVLSRGFTCMHSRRTRWPERRGRSVPPSRPRVSVRRTPRVLSHDACHPAVCGRQTGECGAAVGRVGGVVGLRLAGRCSPWPQSVANPVPPQWPTDCAGCAQPGAAGASPRLAAQAPVGGVRRQKAAPHQQHVRRAPCQAHRRQRRRRRRGHGGPRDCEARGRDRPEARQEAPRRAARPGTALSLRRLCLAWALLVFPWRAVLDARISTRSAGNRVHPSVPAGLVESEPAVPSSSRSPSGHPSQALIAVRAS